MGRILVVDDEELVGTALLLLLESDGHQAFYAADGESCIRICAEQQPNLAIVDLILPDTTGVELIGRMRRFELCPKIIAISGGGGRGRASLLTLARRAGADEAFTKPINSREFRAAVSRLVGT